MAEQGAIVTELATWSDSVGLAEWLGVPVTTVRKWRLLGTGPRAHKLGRHVRYFRPDVEAWVRDHAEPDQGAESDRVMS